MKRFIQLLAIVTSSILAFSAFSAAIYTWTDANGVVHYSQQPPKGVNATIISSEDMQPKKIGTKTPTRFNDGSVEESDLARSAKLIKEKDAQQAKSICDNAKHSLDLLNTYTRLTKTDDSGEEVTMTEEDKQSARADNEQRIKLFCQ
ncbi:DUF4124 domain-containing protein [Shewanella gaetbuli]